MRFSQAVGEPADAHAGDALLDDVAAVGVLLHGARVGVLRRDGRGDAVLKRVVGEDGGDGAVRLVPVLCDRHLRGGVGAVVPPAEGQVGEDLPRMLDGDLGEDHGMRFLRLVVPVADGAVIGVPHRALFHRHVLRALGTPRHEDLFAVLDQLLRHALAVCDDGVCVEFIVLERALFRLGVHRQCLPECVARDDDDGDNAVARGRAHGVAVP